MSSGAAARSSKVVPYPFGACSAAQGFIGVGIAQ